MKLRSAGRKLNKKITAMQFAPGDVIQDYEEPFIKYMNVSCKNWYCNSCFKDNTNLLRCVRCKNVFYCDSTCQKLDWKNSHSIECKLYAKADTLQISTSDDTINKIIKLMCYLKLHKKSANKSVQLYDGSERCFNDLQYHLDEINNVPEISNTMETLAGKLNDSQLFTTLECSYEKIVILYGIWKTNGFAIANETDTVIIGGALYVLGSGFNHSCRPNAVRVIDETFRMQIRCIDAIHAGEKPLISYLAGIRNRECRQATLKQRYDFNCECVLCEMEKDNDMVDYNALLAARDSFNQQAFYTDDQLNAARKIVNEMEKIFSRYDERITNFCDYTLEQLVITLEGPHAHKVSVPDVKKFAEKVEEKIRITFGRDHKDYKYFNEEIAPRLLATYIRSGFCNLKD